MDRGLIKYGDRKRLTLVLTTKGKLHRLTTHPQWALIPGIALLVVVTFGILNYTKNTGTSNESEESNSSNLKPFDSSQSQSFQTQTLKNSDSSLKQTDTTKTNDTTTKH